MRELKIAYGRSCDALKWINSKITWEELCEKLRTTVKTDETAEEYKNMEKKQRDAIKDRGGFVGGYLRGGRRLIDRVVSRSILSFDVDFAVPGFIERFKRECRYAAVYYTTHSHTPKEPRYRIIILLEEDVSPDECVAVSRYYAALWGIDQFDPCSFRVNQLMYWPTTPSDVDYDFGVIEGPPLNAEEFLGDYPDWRDCSKLPFTKREKEVRVRDGKKQEDPLTKEGIVGTFCRVYSIEDAISKFLSDVYAPSVKEGRYDYIPGEGSCGVVVYDDKFAYSHHATDPAGGDLRNAFDLVRMHRFKEEDAKTSFLKMAAFAEEDSLVKEELEKEKLEQAQKDFEEIQSSWEDPIPFGRYEVASFPVDALPLDIGAYVEAVAESTQTPVDMAGTVAIALMSVCIQGKYAVQGKEDWTEPLNTFTNIIASPSERKSAVLKAMAGPLDNYEVQYNKRNAARVESSKMQRRILERRQKAIEDKVAKGNAEPGDMEKIAQEIAEYQEEKPLHLYVDDITTEKLASVMSGNKGRAALVSSEGGIFDTLAGIYTKTVNIDVFLKGYSGDTIRVDRIGRESESIMNPKLTVLLMTQPKVISDVLGNATFRGRGLTARFLYCFPESTVGKRKFRSNPVPEEVLRRYEQKIVNLLDDEYPPKPEIITLSEEAAGLLTAFAEEVEAKMKTDYAEIADWAGKLIGNTLRISGLLCRAGVYRAPDFLTERDTLEVDGLAMSNAIKLGRYFISHALTVYDVIPEDAMYKQAMKILKMIREKSMTEFDRRMAMRSCRIFKTVAEIQPVLDFLEDYGYITRRQEKTTFSGRPPLPKYVVNPSVLSLLSK